MAERQCPVHLVGIGLQDANQPLHEGLGPVWLEPTCSLKPAHDLVLNFRPILTETKEGYSETKKRDCHRNSIYVTSAAPSSQRDPSANP